MKDPSDRLKSDAPIDFGRAQRQAPVRAVLSLKEASSYVHLCEKEIRWLCGSGQLRAFRTRGGGAWRIPVISCDEYIALQLSAEAQLRAKF